MGHGIGAPRRPHPAPVYPVSVTWSRMVTRSRLRVRFSYLTDEDIAGMERTYAPDLSDRPSLRVIDGEAGEGRAA